MCTHDPPSVGRVLSVSEERGAPAPLVHSVWVLRLVSHMLGRRPHTLPLHPQAHTQRRAALHRLTSTTLGTARPHSRYSVHMRGDPAAIARERVSSRLSALRDRLAAHAPRVADDAPPAALEAPASLTRTAGHRSPGAARAARRLRQASRHLRGGRRPAWAPAEALAPTASRRADSGRNACRRARCW